jgi:hypothetical protein
MATVCQTGQLLQGGAIDPARAASTRGPLTVPLLQKRGLSEHSHTFTLNRLRASFNRMKR